MRKIAINAIYVNDSHKLKYNKWKPNFMEKMDAWRDKFLIVAIKYF